MVQLELKSWEFDPLCLPACHMGLTRSVHMLQVEEAAGAEAPGWVHPAGSSESPPGHQGVPGYAAAPGPAREFGSRGFQPGPQGQLAAHADSGELAPGTARPAGSGESQPDTMWKRAQDLASHLFRSPHAVGSVGAGEQPPSPSRAADLSKSSLQRAEQGEEALVQEWKAVGHGLLQRAPPGSSLCGGCWTGAAL